MAMNESFPLETVLAALGGRRAVDITGLDAEVLAWLAVALHARTQRPCVLVVPEDSDARRVAADLGFFTDAERVSTIPLVEASPYGDLSPDRASVMALLASLSHLAWGQGVWFTVVPAAALARRVIPSAVLVEHSHLVAVGQRLDREACLRALADGGYHAVGTVEDPGTFAVRGGIIDVYVPHLKLPVRIDLFGDEVESLRFFDPETQLTRGPAGDTLVLPPVREEILSGAFRDRARLGIRDAAAEAGLPTRSLQPLLDDLANGIPFMGIEGFRPCFFDRLDPLSSHLPKDALWLVLDPMGTAEKLRSYWEKLASGFETVQAAQLPAVPPERHALRPAEAIQALEDHLPIRAHVLQISGDTPIEGPERSIVFHVPTNQDLSHRLEQAHGEREPLKPLAEDVRAWTRDGARVVIACRQQTQLDRLERLLKGYGVPVTLGDQPPRAYLQPPGPNGAGAVLVQGEAGGGFRLLSHGFALITEDEIFGRKARKRQTRKADTASPFIQSFRELEPGDHVVHADHGIGQYVGLKKLIVQGREADFLVVQFAGADKLYLPVYKLGRLQKFVGGSENPRMDKLGGTSWQKVRSKASAAAEEDALALLDLYARRELAAGYAFSTPDDYFRAFEARFPFQETPDQERAIDEVLADMARPRPMDRLLCGDVGFGKTEVALRAAMKAVLDGKQVALLVPTTVLAFQHYRTFTARFAGYPMTVGLMSRFVEGEDEKEVLKGLKTGRVDVVIGTHRLLSQDVVFHDLGLLVLDEEHRFGVRHKERLKEMRTNVDVLSMTATPIPRTLQLSIAGIRDLSVITTPPNDRLSVRTYVCRATDQVVRESILRELARGGQVFFVHNRVHSIEARKAWLTSLVPEARIAIGHGQMDPKQLEKVMVDFTEGRTNVLLSTTIIESGIDIPSANTMLIDHADQLGLAQLYQLRGRVGRSRERGYCYLLVPSEAALSGEARQRLAVIQKFTELGSGFHVASHDMEIRGAGELLGTRQKGHVQAVGVDLYAQLIEEAVTRLKGQKPPVQFDPDLNLPVTARIPEEYVPDDRLRLVLYKRLSNAVDEESVLAIGDEIQDRFGPLPGPVDNLIEVMRIRTLARQVGLNNVDLGADRVLFTFHPESPMPIEAIIDLVSDKRTGYTAPADFKLVYLFNTQERTHALAGTRKSLQKLAEAIPVS